jgi:hypothetical protein
VAFRPRLQQRHHQKENGSRATFDNIPISSFVLYGQRAGEFESRDTAEDRAVQQRSDNGENWPNAMGLRARSRGTVRFVRQGLGVHTFKERKKIMG